MTSPSLQAPVRFHFLDTARALLMVLGVPFHAALIYTSAPWLLQSPDTTRLIEWLPPVSSTFRMPAFFLIAGFFAAMLLEKRSRVDWMRDRIERLGLPLVSGALLIVPAQLAMLRYAPDTAVTWPNGLEKGVLSHLWFLPVLLMLCGALAALWPQVSKVRWADLPTGMLGMLYGGFLVVIYGVDVKSGGLLQPFGGLLNLEMALMQAPFFLWGVAARRDARVRERLLRFSPATLVLGCLAAVVHIWLWQGRETWQIALDLMIDGLASICLVQGILALLARWADRPSPRVAKLVDASFSIYLFHHPIVLAMGIILLSVALPPLLKWAIVTATALTLSYALHRGMRRSPLLMQLFNGVRPSKTRGLLVTA